MTLETLRRFPRGMRDRGMIAAALIATLIAVFVAAFFPWRMERQSMRSALAKATAVREIAAYGLRAPLVFNDVSAVNEVVAAALTDSDVVLVSVRDAQGKSILNLEDDAVSAGAAASFRGTSTRAVRDHDLLVTEGPVTMDGDTVGTIRLGFSLATLRADVASARRAGMVFGSLILILGVAIAYGAVQYISRPLRQLSATARQIAAGDLSQRALPARDEEVADLVVAFNRMVDAVVAAQAQLAATNVELEVRVQDRTRMLRAFVELVPQPIISVDRDWRVTRWNRAAEQLFGWSEAELLGKHLPYADGDAAASFADGRFLLETGRKVPPTEAVRMRRDGTAVNVLISAAPLSDGGETNLGYVAVLTDLTERKALEDQLRQSQKMEAVGRLAGGVAHDFNNILTVITVTTALLLEEELAPGLRDDVRAISDAALRAAGLTRQLLAFSRSQVLTLTDLNVAGVVDHLMPMVRRLMRENVRIETHLDSHYYVRADAGQIEQVVMNLVVNAADAMPAGGSIRVLASDVTVTAARPARHTGLRPGEYVRLQVADTGTGMDEKTLSRIFEPFFTTKPLGKGTGLGLATTYAIVDRLGGHIDVRSTPGAGTVFDIYIPRTATPAGRTGEVREDSTRTDGRETVLLVEDEDSVRLMLRRSLERLGYAVRDAASAEAALAQLDADPVVDVVVTDLMMPGMNGRQLSERLTYRLPNVPVIVMTGYADAELTGDGFLDTGRPLLLKPITGQTLAREIRTVLDADVVAT